MTGAGILQKSILLVHDRGWNDARSARQVQAGGTGTPRPERHVGPGGLRHETRRAPEPHDAARRALRSGGRCHLRCSWRRRGRSRPGGRRALVDRPADRLALLDGIGDVFGEVAGNFMTGCQGPE